MPDDASPVRFIAQEQWQSLSDLFRQAEAALHEAEMIHGDLGIPSVNQLRYAGHHVLAISTSSTKTDALEAYNKAIEQHNRGVYIAYASLATALVAALAAILALL